MEANGERGDTTHLSDPGKEARARSGIPIVPAFDGFRAFAIAGVVLLHLCGISGVIERSGDGIVAVLINGTFGHAIDVLFVVSGFVVFLPTVARSGDFGRIGAYAIRRAARLFPAYWLILALIFILLATVPVTPDVGLPGARDIGIHIFGLQTPAGMFISGIPMGFGINPPVWTLSLEVTFYIVLPLIASVYFRHPLIGLGIAALITVAWTTGFENIAWVTSKLGIEVSGIEMLRLLVASDQQLPSWAFSFALGMTGAWAYVRIRAMEPDPRRDRIIRIVQLVSLAGLLFFVWRAGSFAGDAPLKLVAQVARHDIDIALGYSACLAVLMVATTLGPSWAQKPFSVRPVRQLGDISYGIFLSHVVFIYYAGQLLDLPQDGTAATLLLWIAIVIPASTLYGYLSARFLEQPVRRWARRFGRAAEPAAPSKSG